jgi:hypothetical protein
MRVPVLQSFDRAGLEPFPSFSVWRLDDSLANCAFESARRGYIGATEMAVGPSRKALVALPLVAVAGCASWLLIFDLSRSDAQIADKTAVAVQQDGVAVPEDRAPASPDAAPAAPVPNPAASAIVAEPLGHLRLTRQSVKRGGLGSKALLTFTIRNDNDFAVKNPEILCSFRSRDGGYATQRRRTINDTVNAKSRKAFPPTLIGFVNIKASKAKCSLLTASRG